MNEEELSRLRNVAEGLIQTLNTAEDAGSYEAAIDRVVNEWRAIQAGGEGPGAPPAGGKHRRKVLW